jgi:hypothetical protein
MNDEKFARLQASMEQGLEHAKVADRFNEGKVDFTLLPVEALEAEARVWMLGAEKYSRYNWQKLWGEESSNVIMASLLRHAFAIQQGEVTDKETGEYHAAHIRCNAAMLIHYYTTQGK